MENEAENTEEVHKQNAKSGWDTPTLAGFPTDLATLNERADELKEETGSDFRHFIGCGG